MRGKEKLLAPYPGASVADGAIASARRSPRAAPTSISLWSGQGAPLLSTGARASCSSTRGETEIAWTG